MSTSPASREYELAARFLALPKERRRRLFAGLQAQGIALAVLPVPLAPAGPERERLSYAQERLWFLAQLDPDSVAYNMAGALRLRGVPDASALERAIGAIVQRHEALRTTFETHAGVARAVVHAELTLPLVQVDARAEFARDGELCVRAWAEREAQVVFELSRGPLLRVALVRFAADDYGLFVCMHHVVSDGWSLRLFIAEFAQHYDAFVNGAAPELPPVAVQYADYATWQRSWLEAGELERQLAYWREQLAGEQRVLRLPTDRPRPDVQSQRGAVHAFSWPAPLVRDMRRLAQAQGVTLFMLGLAAFDALLHRVTGETDLWIGSSIANRNRLETEASIGFFVNTQVLRTTVLPEQTFAQLLAAVKHVALAAQTHQDLPFEQLVEALAPERSLAHNPLFQVHYDHQSRAYDTLRSLAGLRITDIAREQSSTMFDLMLTTLEQPDGTISAGFGYATDLFERATVERFAQRLTRLLELAVSAPDTQVAQLVWLEPHEHVAQGHLPLRAADDATGGRAIAAPQPRAYAAPSSAVERQLSAIWCEVLQLPDVSLDDNFFELGGDSIISIQVVSRARERGLVLRPKDLFQHQTLRRLAAVVTLASGAVSLAAASGDYPLTPIQIAFFARALPEPQHFNQAVLLECKQPLVNKTLERALAAVIAQHEALVMSFRQREVGSAWRQYSGNDATHVLTTAHVGDRAEIRVRCEAAQRSLNLERGELLRALHLRLPDGSSLLLLVVHHLVVDGVSWRVLLEDLQRAYTNPELALPPRTSAFGHWAERLHEYAESPALAAEFEYWQRTAARIRPLPVDHVEQATPLTIAEVERVAVRLNHVETEQLLKHSAAAYRTHIQELLLAALTRALCETFGQSEVSVLLEGHGREDVFDGVDVSRTVGWFTSEYPVVLASAVELSDTIKQVKEQLRNVPQRGLGYGVLATLGSADQRQQLTAAHAPSIAFNYLGQFDATFGEDALFRAASENAGSDAAASTPLAHALEINGQVYAGELTLWIGFSPRQYERATVQRLAELFEQALRAVITHNTTPGVGSVTPSDYPLARLDQHELDALVVEARPADLYPVTAMQHGLLFHALYDSEPGIYVTQLAVTIAGLDTARFVAAWRRALERHTILRTSFVWDLQREPLQFVHEKAELAYEFCDLRGVPDQAEQLHTFVREQHRRGFALGRAPLWRVALVQLDERRQHFVWTHHHLLLDGWSTARLLDEVLLDYLGRDAREPSHAFADYVAWLSRRDLPASETFWRERLRQLEEPTLLAGYLPAADSGEARKTTGVQMVRSLLSEAETSALTALAQQQHVTVSALVQAAWALILQRYTGQTSVVFGATTSGRPPELPGSESMLGLFINTLPVIVNAQPTAALGEFWQTLQQAGSAAREHEHTPLASLQRWAGTSELFDTLIVFENFPIDNALRADWQELAFGPVETLEITNYALTLAVHPGAQLALGLAFDPAQLAQSGVQLIAAQMSALLRSFVRESPRMSTGQLALFGEPAQQSAAATTPATPLHALILGRMLARGSQEQAVVSGGGEAWTAALLEQRVLTLTARLRARGVTRESLVGLYVQRGPWLVAGALAVWRAGAAYVPLDPAYPRERLAWMVADAGLALVLSTHGYPELNVDTLWIADEADAAVSAPLTAAVDVRPEQLAYVIYTSGSTGTPKGVAVAHGALNMHAHAIAEQYHMTEDDCALHMASASFDAAVEQWTTPLLSGARLFFCDEQPWTAPETLALLRRERVTVVYPPTSQLIVLCQYLEQSGEEYKLRICCVGGEAVSRESVALIRRSVRPELIINGYGPTETVVTPMAWRATPELACATPYAPIGWVIGDRSAYVLDAELNLLPRGVAGELYLGGTGMARGYLGRPQLTAASFVPDPFSATPGARLYRTGDRVRALPDGVIEFLGRVDHQVKLRGYRIELGEIEARLLAQREVGEAVVVVRNDSGRPQLVAYVSCNDVEATQLTAAIAQRLRAELPAHMVPAHIVALTQLPHTPNGKIDRRALPAPLHIVGERTPARNELESALCAAFADVLGTHELGVHDDFFELGGDSLSSLQLVSRLRAHGHTLSLREVFELRNVAALAAVLSARVQVASAQPQIERVTREPVHALSHAQERLWFLAQLEPDSAAYNISGGLRLRGSLDYTRLQQSFQSLVTRHEALRTSFEERDGRGVQRIHAHAQVVLQLLAARGPDSEQRARELFAAELLQPFDLAQAPLLRVVLIQLADEDHVLAVSLHHMVADGWSMRLLIEEFAQAYANGASLPEPSLQYLDYASWQRNWLGAGELTRQLAYWREQLGDEHPVLELPLDHPRPAAPTRRGGAFVFTLDARTSAGVVQLAHACNASVFMVLLAAFESVLYRMTGQRDLRVGVPVSNRNRLDTESVVGLFVNTLVLRTQLDGALAFADLVARVRETSLAAQSHQDLPFELLVEDLAPERSLAHNPLFQVLFDHQRSGLSALHSLSGLTAEPYAIESRPAKFDLSLEMIEDEGVISGNFAYASELFEPA
ncbi:MAG: Linear gramicidin synthase subunit, partial [Pseudomonadota bacterium]